MNTVFHLILLSVILLTGGNVFSQPVSSLAIGDTVKGEAWSLIQTQGKKLYILDFWSTSCVSCIVAFPKMNQLKNDFKDELEIFLVNSYETGEQVSSRMQKINNNRAKNGSPPILIPPLPQINGDSILKNLFPHVGVPHHVWLDAHGKVLYITNGNNATSDNVRMALEGATMNLAFKRDLKAEGFNAWKTGLIQPGHIALKPAIYSGFIKYTSGLGGGNSEVTDTNSGVFRRSWMNTDIIWLFKSASYKMNPVPRVINELVNKENYELPANVQLHDKWREQYSFSYEILLPIEDKHLIGEFMLTDLNRFCNNKFKIEGVLEKRTMKAYVLVVSNPTLIKTSELKRESKRTESKISWTNTPIFVIGNTLRTELEDLKEQIIFINEADPGNTIMADMELILKHKDPHGLKKQLQQYGLDLLIETREIDVLVLRDK